MTSLADHREGDCVRVESPEDLLSTIPVLLGHAPEESVVAIGLDPITCRVNVTARQNLPASLEDGGLAAGHAASLIDALARHHVAAAVAVGYGAEALVTPVAEAIFAGASRAGIEVREFLRVHGHRYWSYTCASPGHCPPEGTPFCPGTSLAKDVAPARSMVLTTGAEVALAIGP